MGNNKSGIVRDILYLVRRRFTEDQKSVFITDPEE